MRSKLAANTPYQTLPANSITRVVCLTRPPVSCQRQYCSWVPTSLPASSIFSWQLPTQRLFWWWWWFWPCLGEWSSAATLSWLPQSCDNFPFFLLSAVPVLASSYVLGMWSGRLCTATMLVAAQWKERSATCIVWLCASYMWPESEAHRNCCFLHGICSASCSFFWTLPEDEVCTCC